MNSPYTERVCSPIGEQVCLGPEGIVEGAAAGTGVLDLTSGNPPHTVQIATRLAERGIHFIDAGVSGGIPGAEAGTPGIMVGDDASVYDACLVLGKNRIPLFFRAAPERL
jgi:3-hydroxyisobutyrate dehydrogenase-like beta-hydroxyacid dehydrogenase